jgi:hypothetical protein
VANGERDERHERHDEPPRGETAAAEREGGDRERRDERDEAAARRAGVGAIELRDARAAVVEAAGELGAGVIRHGQRG